MFDFDGFEDLFDLGEAFDIDEAFEPGDSFETPEVADIYADQVEGHLSNVVLENW